MTFAHSLEGNNSMLRAITFAALAVALTLSLAGPLPQAMAAERQAPAAQAGSNRLYLPGVIRYNNPAYISPFGVTMFDEVSDRTGLTAMANAGADYAMVNARWVDIEPTEGAPYNFSTIDARIQALAGKGIKPLVLFDHNPAWAMSPPSNITAPIRWAVADNKLGRLDAVIRALAERYNGSNGYPRVDYWGFYGEPDNRAAWGFVGTLTPCPPGTPTCNFNNPAAYADMLARVSPIIKSVNSNAKVMIGALAFENNVPNVFNYQFMDQVLTRLATKPGGITAYLDYVGFNFFPSIGANPRFDTLQQKAAAARGVLAARGVPNMPIIVLELGLWTGATGGANPPYPANETDQARFVVKEYVRGLSAGITQMHFFQPLDVPNYFNWGLFRGTQNANDPKPSYTSYVVVARELDNSLYTGSISAGGLEGYTFSKDGGAVTVFWGTGGNVTRDFAGACVRTVTRTNQPVQVSDNQAGDGNNAAGIIRISAVANEPVFVTNCP